MDGSAPVEESTAVGKGASGEKTAVGYCQACNADREER